MLRSAIAVAFPLLLLVPAALSAATPDPLVAELVARYGEAERPRVERGFAQLDAFWRAEDGDRAARDEFARTHFAGDAATRDALFDRLEAGLESLDGHLAEISRDWRAQSDLDRGPILPFDEIMAAWIRRRTSPTTCSATSLAFVVLLNFPLTTLDERLARGESWIAPRVGRGAAGRPLREAHPVRRQPGDRRGGVARRRSTSPATTSGCTTCVDESGERLFPPKLRLLSHWNLRDELKASYGDARTGWRSSARS